MKRWEAIREITKILLEPVIERVKIEKITGVLQQFLNVSRCVILEIREDGTEYEIITAQPFSVQEHGIGEVGPISGRGAIEEVIKTKKVILVTDTQSNPLTAYMSYWAVIKGINAVLFVPIVIDEEVEAIMVFDATKERQSFSEEEIEFIVNCAIFIEELFAQEKETYRRQQQALSQEQLQFSFQFCDDLAHRVRSDLATIGGWATRTIKLVEEFAKIIPRENGLVTVLNKIKENLSIIQEREMSCELVFNDLSGLAKTEKQLRPVEVDLNLLILRVLDELSGKKPTVRYQLNLNPLPPLKLDLEKMRLALRYILTNVYEEVEKNQDPVCQEVQLNSQLKNEKVELIISNHGTLNSRTIECIIKPFIDTTTLGSLGLPIAKKLIILNGGDLTVKSEKGRVTYRLIFPLSAKNYKEQLI